MKKNKKYAGAIDSATMFLADAAEEDWSEIEAFEYKIIRLWEFLNRNFLVIASKQKYHDMCEISWKY